jgi:hypothetical protein
MLRDHLYAFANGTIDRFLIQHEEIPLVASWMAVKGIVAYGLRPIRVNGEVLYEVYRDRWRVHFQVAMPRLLSH